MAALQVLTTFSCSMVLRDHTLEVTVRGDAPRRAAARQRAAASESLLCAAWLELWNMSSGQKRYQETCAVFRGHCYGSVVFLTWGTSVKEGSLGKNKLEILLDD